MTKRYIYLAGPIVGCTEDEAKDWREFVYAKLKEKGSGIVGISPLRCEPSIEGGYALETADPMFGTSRAISSKNIMDVQACDLLLAYLPKELAEKRPSYGTVVEMAWGKWAGKPVILVTDDPYVAQHPVLNACASWVLGSIEEALQVIHGLFDDYVEEG